MTNEFEVSSAQTVRQFCDERKLNARGLENYASAIMRSRQTQLNIITAMSRDSNSYGRSHREYALEREDRNEEFIYCELRNEFAERYQNEVFSLDYYIVSQRDMWFSSRRPDRLRTWRRQHRARVAILGCTSDAAVIVNERGVWHFPTGYGRLDYHVLSVDQYMDELAREREFVRYTSKARVVEYVAFEQRAAEALRGYAPRKRRQQAPPKPTHLPMSVLEQYFKSGALKYSVGKLERKVRQGNFFEDLDD